MTNRKKYSPGPWKWTDFGVLSDANGEAILDYEDWQVSPENAALVQRAPELYECLTRLAAKYGNQFAAEDRALISACLELG